MKTYKSHKTVEAAKILRGDSLPASGSAVLDLGEAGTVRVAHEWIRKNGEVASLIGGYFVRYPDGYTSWSPASAFEEGYTEHSLDPKDGALPVAGYKPQTGAKVALVNSFKAAEERVLRLLDEAVTNAAPGEIDGRWYAIGRTHLEQGWMAINRAVFQPGRAKLPEDN